MCELDATPTPTPIATPTPSSSPNLTVSQKTAGESCTRTDDCQSGLVCKGVGYSEGQLQEGTCQADNAVAIAPTPSSTSTPAQTFYNWSFSQQTCVGPYTDGEYASKAECTRDHEQSAQTAIAKGAKGTACMRNSQCADGLDCIGAGTERGETVAGICQPKPSVFTQSPASSPAQDLSLVYALASSDIGKAIFSSVGTQVDRVTQGGISSVVQGIVQNATDNLRLTPLGLASQGVSSMLSNSPAAVLVDALNGGKNSNAADQLAYALNTNSNLSAATRAFGAVDALSNKQVSSAIDYVVNDQQSKMIRSEAACIGSRIGAIWNPGTQTCDMATTVFSLVDIPTLGLASQYGKTQIARDECSAALRDPNRSAKYTPEAINVCANLVGQYAKTVFDTANVAEVAGGVVKSVSNTVMGKLESELLGGLSGLDNPTFGNGPQTALAYGTSTRTGVQQSVAVMPDSHSMSVEDFIDELHARGIVNDEGQPVQGVILGDFYGKTTTDLLGAYGTPGGDLFEYATQLADASEGSVRVVSGNWEPRTAAAVAATLRGETTELKAILKKTLPASEVEAIISSPESVASFADKLGKLENVTQVGETVLQHTDTAQSLLFSLDESDMAKLAAKNPQLADEIEYTKWLHDNAVGPNAVANPVLTAEDIQRYQQAYAELGLAPQDIVANINTSTQDILQQGVLQQQRYAELAATGLSQEEMITVGMATAEDFTRANQAYADLQYLHKNISKDLTFFQDAGESVQAYAQTFNAQAVGFGHTPVSTLDPVSLAGAYQEVSPGVWNVNGVLVQDFDTNVSSGMRSILYPTEKNPKGFLKIVNGVMQLPEDRNLLQSIDISSGPTSIPTTFSPPQQTIVPWVQPTYSLNLGDQLMNTMDDVIQALGILNPNPLPQTQAR